MQIVVGDTVKHFRTGRRGVVRFLGQHGRVAIKFDDGYEEWRWMNAFVKTTKAMAFDDGVLAMAFDDGYEEWLR